MRTCRSPQPLAQSVVEIPGNLGTARGSIYVDPADHLIVVSALERHQLEKRVTRILTWSGAIDRMDAK